MEESLEGFKKRIECLEAENKEIREYSRLTHSYWIEVRLIKNEESRRKGSV